jgi:hypothetical protein
MGKNFEQNSETMMLKKIKKCFNNSKDKLSLDIVYYID